MLTAFPVAAIPQDVGLPHPDSTDPIAGAMFRLVLGRLVPDIPPTARAVVPTEVAVAPESSQVEEEISVPTVASEPVDSAGPAFVLAVSGPGLITSPAAEDPELSRSLAVPVHSDAARQTPEQPDSMTPGGPRALPEPSGEGAPVPVISGEKKDMPPKSALASQPESLVAPPGERVRRPVGSALSRAILESRLLPPGMSPPVVTNAQTPVLLQQPAAPEAQAPAPAPLSAAVVGARPTPSAPVPAPFEAASPKAAAVPAPDPTAPPNPAAERMAAHETVAAKTVATTTAAITTAAGRTAFGKSADLPDRWTPARSVSSKGQTIPPTEKPVLPAVAAPVTAVPLDQRPAAALRVSAPARPTASPAPPVPPTDVPPLPAAAAPPGRVLGVDLAVLSPQMPVEPVALVVRPVAAPAPKASPDPMAPMQARSPEVYSALPATTLVQATTLSSPVFQTNPVRTDHLSSDVVPAESPRIDVQRPDANRPESPRPVLPFITFRQIAEAVPPVDGPGFDLSLSPEELGQVRLRLTSAEGGMLLIIHAERAETLELLRRHIGSLEQELRDLGHEGLTLRFSGGGGGADPGPHRPPDPAQPHDSRAARVELSLATGSAEPRSAPRSLNDHLDLRL